MTKLLQFEVSLQHIRPRIWRRFEIDAKATFEDLHLAIQDAFGWQQTHLYEFRRGARGVALARMPSPKGQDFWEDLGEAPDADRARVADAFTVAGANAKCVYVYDFGDRWGHLVRLRKVVETKERVMRRLLAGKRSGPPEDCGGVPGYYGCCEFVATGTHPEHGDFGDWLGEWKPDAFDLEAAKRTFDR